VDGEVAAQLPLTECEVLALSIHTTVYDFYHLHHSVALIVALQNILLAHWQRADASDGDRESPVWCATGFFEKKRQDGCQH